MRRIYGVGLVLLVACSGVETIRLPGAPIEDASAGIEDSSTPSLDAEADSDADAGCKLGRYFVDKDGDGFGAGPQVEVCEPTGPGFSTIAGDCDDNDARAFPGQTVPQVAKDGGTTDFNCDSNTVLEHRTSRLCNGTSGCFNGDQRDFWLSVVPECGKPATFVTRCSYASQTTCRLVTEERIQECL